MIKKIKELSLKQELFFPCLIVGLILNLAFYLVLSLGLNVHFGLFQVRDPIEINLYRSFKEVKRQAAVPRGARKIVPLEEVKELPWEVVEEEAVERKEPEGGGAASIAEAYFGAVYSRIKRRKYYPEAEKDRYHEGVVKVGFVINKDGTLRNLRIVRSCKYKGLNKAALATVKRAAPFMPIPDQLKADKLPVVIDIVYKII